MHEIKIISNMNLAPYFKLNRSFIRSRKLLDMSINSNSFLYFYLELYARCATGYTQIKKTGEDTIYKHLNDGELVTTEMQLREIFHTCRPAKTMEMLERMQEEGLLRYLVAGKEIYLCINKTYRHQECRGFHKKNGYILIDRDKIDHLVGVHSGKVPSLRDMYLDLWLHTTVADPHIKAPENLPVVYFAQFDHCGGDCRLMYKDLAKRWNTSVGNVSKSLNKMIEMGLIRIYSFNGNRGNIIEPVGFIEEHFGTGIFEYDVISTSEAVAELEYMYPVYFGQKETVITLKDDAYLEKRYQTQKESKDARAEEEHVNSCEKEPQEDCLIEQEIPYSYYDAYLALVQEGAYEMKTEKREAGRSGKMTARENLKELLDTEYTTHESRFLNLMDYLRDEAECVFSRTKKRLCKKNLFLPKKEFPNETQEIPDRTK